MFMGEYDHTIDAKGRLIIPAKFREELGDSFYIGKGTDGNLNVYTTEYWMEFEKKLSELPSTLVKKTRQLKRFYMAGTELVELDKQGRVLVPNKLREHAGLTKDVTLVGVGDKVEIWSTERWIESAPENIDDIEADLAEMGYEL